jgi:hypothetical protein
MGASQNRRLRLSPGIFGGSAAKGPMATQLHLGIPLAVIVGATVPATNMTIQNHRWSKKPSGLDSPGWHAEQRQGYAIQ